MSSRKALPYAVQLLDAERVLINPLNHSSAKQQYSFPKASRFERCHTHNDSYRFYDIPSTRTRLATTIGRQPRDPTPRRHLPSPSPLNYNYATDGEFAYSLHLRAKKSKGFNFGLGREDVKVNSFLAIPRGSSPDPGSYDPEKAHRHHQKQYSFSKAKKSTIADAAERSLAPGPGAYKVETSLSENKQLLSIHPKAAAPKMMQQKTDSKKPATRYPPLYHPKTTAKGEVLDLSAVRRGVVIGNSQREYGMRSVNPGPGQYKIFSEFIGKGKA